MLGGVPLVLVVFLSHPFLPGVSRMIFSCLSYISTETQGYYDGPVIQGCDLNWLVE